MQLTEETWVVQALANGTFLAAQSLDVYQFSDILVSVLSEIHSRATEPNLELSYAKGLNGPRPLARTDWTAQVFRRNCSTLEAKS